MPFLQSLCFFSQLWGSREEASQCRQLQSPERVGAKPIAWRVNGYFGRERNLMQDKFKVQRNKSICLNYFTVFVLVVWLINSYHTEKNNQSELLHTAECSLLSSSPDDLDDHVLSFTETVLLFSPNSDSFKRIPSNISSPQSSVLPLASYPQLHPFSLKYHFPSSASPIMVPNFQHIPPP